MARGIVLVAGALLGLGSGVGQLATLRYGVIAPEQRLLFWSFFLGLGLATGAVLAPFARDRRRVLPGFGVAVVLFALFPHWNARDLPHVLLVVTDTTRADHLSLYGYERDTTPHLEDLADESVVFTAAMSQGSSTIVTVPCLLASCYPSDHGMVDYRAVLSDRFDLVSEILRARGYGTFAVVTNPHLDAASGYGQGFDTYERIGMGTERAVYAETVNARVTALVDSLGNERPLFGFVFYTDPHAPYMAPKEYRARYDPDWPWGTPVFVWQPRDGRPGDRTLFNLIAQYDAAIHYWDEKFRDLLLDLKRRDLWDDALLVYTSDHGEEFWEHGWAAHGHTLYEELVHVPLVVSLPVPVRWPPLPRIRGRVDEVVSSVDVVPTLLDYLRLPVPERARGRSAHALLVGRPDPGPERTAYLEEILRDRHDIRAIRTRTHKCILTLLDRGRMLPGGDMLFDLERDPDERHNLVDRDPEQTARFRELLAARVNDVTTSAIARNVESIEVDDARLAELRALGYLD